MSTFSVACFHVLQDSPLGFRLYSSWTAPFFSGVTINTYLEHYCHATKEVLRLTY